MAEITTQSIQTGINELLARIQKEGITGTAGEVLLKPQALATTPTGQITPTIAPIPADTLGQAITPIQIPPITPKPDTASALIAGAEAGQKSIEDYIKLFTPPAMSPESQRIKELTSQVESLLPEMKGRGAAQLEAETKLQIPEQTQALKAVQDQINTRLAEFKKVEADYLKTVQATEQVPGVVKPIVAGQQREIQKALNIERVAQAAEIGILQAQASALQGNLALAQSQANRAVDLKYSDIQDDINIRLQQLKLIEPELTKQEKIRASAITAYLNDQKTTIATQQANEKDKNATLLNQMQKYPDAGIQLTDTLEQANQKITIRSAIYRKEVVGGTTITSDDTRNLIGAGFTTNEIPQIVSDINTYGIDKVLEGITDKTQRDALGKIYGVKEKVTREQIVSKVTLKQAQDGLKDTYTEYELFELAKEHGFASFWTGKAADIKRFLASDKAKELYVDILYKQYQEAGLTD